jgi:hypothetical protein
MTKLLVTSLAVAATLSASTCQDKNIEGTSFCKFMKEFGVIDKNEGYKKTNKEMKKRAKKLGYYASVSEVKHALEGGKVDGKEVVVIDSRTKPEQEALQLKGSVKANLRGWNNAFNNKHSDNLGAVYSFCRTGTDQASSIVNLQFLFQGKAKIFGLTDMVKSCYPLHSVSGNVLEAKLNAKKVYVQQADNGAYYEVNCPEVKNSITPIEVFSKTDIEDKKMLGEDIPSKITMENKKLGKKVTVYKGPDNKYYKKN